MQVRMLSGGKSFRWGWGGERSRRKEGPNSSPGGQCGWTEGQARGRARKRADRSQKPQQKCGFCPKCRKRPCGDPRGEVGRRDGVADRPASHLPGESADPLPARVLRSFLGVPVHMLFI